MTSRIKEIAAASDLTALVSLLSKSGGLLVDLKGESPLGEWYLTALASSHPEKDLILPLVRKPALEPPAVAALESLLGACPLGYCRSPDYHNRTGFYARLFACGKARAYIGYSETLHYALDEVWHNCTPMDQCRTEDRIAVRALPAITVGGQQVGWVDAFAIRSGLVGPKATLAKEFIDLATSWRAYQAILNSVWPETPRYLLAAIEAPPGEAALAPLLYPVLYAACGSRLVVSASGLNDDLRSRGKDIDCRLPPDRTDTKWRKECSTQTLGP